jgi:serine-type D-Ala-D-Ala carboxypeptidase/endopeptidase
VPNSTIQHIISQRVDSQRSTSIVVGVLDPDGQRRVVAHGDPGPGQPPLGPGSVFEIGPIPRVFTATLLADMIQRAEVNLDDPVARFLPSTLRVPTRGQRQITLVDLATQTSGLPRLPTNLRATDPANPLADYTVQQLYAFLSEYVLPRDIGAEYEYSNLGFGLLGHALARRAATNYQQLLAERVLQPLGMTMTGITLTPAMRRQLALPHNDRSEVVAAGDNPDAGLRRAGLLHRHRPADLRGCQP